MADTLISVLVDQVVSHTLQKIENEVRLVKNAKNDVHKLKRRLRLVQALLEDAGKKQMESASIKQWLSQLEEVSYDMDDLLGEWNAAILKSEIEREAESGSIVTGKKVCFPLPSSCLGFKQSVKEVVGLRQFSKKIEELNNELDGTIKLGNELGIVGRVVEPSDRHHKTSSSIKKPKIVTTSFVDENKIHGRAQDMAVLVSKLLCESSGDERIEVVPIVGMGGLGKTTLAQMAYNDDRIKSHFDTRIWVCVSDPFDVFKIAKALVEGLGEKTQAYEELEALMQFVFGFIKGKRFLLVLDDVWSKNKETWDQLIQPLQNGGSGSRIMVTTRNKEVIMMMGVRWHKIDALETLSDEQCWLIIKQLALMEEENNEFAQLEGIGKRIAAKCKGLPLPAKILGGLMCFKKSKKQWEDILHSQLWESKAFDEIFAPLLLSYYNLSPFEKCCFSYCSVFPKDQVIEVDMMVEMWMSQGYFDESNKGRDCFETLAMRSFFQEFRTDEDFSGYTCKIHDIVHDFAQYLTRDKFALMEEDIVRERIVSLDGPARHLTVVIKSPNQFPTFKPHDMNTTGKFRSLYVAQTKSILNTNGMDFLNIKDFVH